MIAFFCNLALLAQMSHWQRLGDGLRGSGRVDFTDMLPYMIGLAVGALGIWAVVQWKKRNDTSQPCDDPWKLFRELCQVHGLSSSDGRLLQKLVEAQKLEQPAEIFVTPQAFESDDHQLRDLRARLF